MKTNIQHCKLVAKRTGIYTIYVFKTDSNQYIMCTKLPKWDSNIIQLGDSGFLEYEEVQQGEKYIDRETGQESVYRFANIYFKEFIKDNISTDEKIIL